MEQQALPKFIYDRFSHFRQEWEDRNDSIENLGLLVFLPDGYVNAIGLEDLKYEYWLLDEAREFLIKGGVSPLPMDELIDGFEYGEAFLVMIVEYLPDTRHLGVQFRKITQPGTN